MKENKITISVTAEEIEALTSVLVGGLDFYKNTPEKEPGQYAEEMRNLKLATKILTKITTENEKA